MLRMKKKKPKVVIGLEMPEEIAYGIASGIVNGWNEYLMSKMSEVMGVPKSLSESEPKLEEFSMSADPINPPEDIEPEWEMDLASGAIRNHDMVVDQNGENFIIMDGKPCFTTSGVVVKPKGELRVVSSTFKEDTIPDPSAVHKFATGGFVPSGKDLLAAIEESGSKSTYKSLTKESLESVIKDLMPGPGSGRDFEVFTGARGYGKSASAAKEFDRVMWEEHKKWVPDPTDTLCIFHEGRVYSIRNADNYLLEKKKASLMNDEERMEMYDLISKELAVRASRDGSGYKSKVGMGIVHHPYTFDEAKSTPKIPTHGDGPRAKSVESKPVSSFRK